MTLKELKIKIDEAKNAFIQEKRNTGRSIKDAEIMWDLDMGEHNVIRKYVEAYQAAVKESELRNAKYLAVNPSLETL